MILALTLIISTIPAWRCMQPETPKGELEKAAAVFSGKVVLRDYVVEEVSPGQLGHRVIFKMSVEQIWKGDISTEVIMYTEELELFNGYSRIYSEDFKFEMDKEYLVYARGEPDRLRTDVCTRTRELSRADDDLKELGPGHPPGSLSPPRGIDVIAPGFNLVRQERR